MVSLHRNSVATAEDFQDQDERGPNGSDVA